MAPLTFNLVPSGIAFKLFLKAVFRIRVATTNEPLSLGLLAKENVRALPSASVSGGLVKMKSAFCPALKV